MNNLSVPKAVIVGVEGTEVSSYEREMFASHNPLGFILFTRNCKEREQIKALAAELRSIVKRPNAPILIDQEGGRVARLRPPLFRECPPASLFAEMAAKDKEEARKATYLNAKSIAEGLLELGISVDCAPVADILYNEAHAIIGDRSFGDTAAQVALLARAMAEGLTAGGVLPIIKHIPGHGRARVDSHEDLPVVDATEAVLRETDFEVFRQLYDMPWAMTAHIIYSAIDPILPATLSPIVIQYIREKIGFKGIIISDDLSMKALKGSFAERTIQLFAAGCDLALHSNGNIDEMGEILSHCPLLSEQAQLLLHKQGLL